MSSKPSLFHLFMVFFRIGAFTVGGGYAMIPLFRHEMVGSRQWFSEGKFTEILALAQGVPGAIAINTAVYAGLSLRGIPGALVAVLGAALPSFLVILGIALIFPRFRTNPTVARAFDGLRPVIVGLVASAAFSAGRHILKSPKPILLSLLSFAGLLLGLHPVLIIMAAGTWGVLSPYLGVKAP